MPAVIEQLRFVWIDDDPERRSDAQNIEDYLTVRVEFVGVRNEDLQLMIDKLIRAPEPDLIILDHNLHDIQKGYFSAGSTAATIIRENWIRCPIICISGADDKYFDAQQRSVYEAIFPINDVARHYQTILSIARSYRKLKEANPVNIEQFMGLLGEPDEEMDRLKSIIPIAIKCNLGDPSIWKEVSQWIRRVLIMRPGFLYDQLWTATFVGIKEESFQKVEAIFESAKYKGLFADHSKPRWWKHKILAILGEKVEGFGLPWEKGIKLPGLSEEDQSVCYVTNEPRPEIVAFLDDSHRERKPMKIKETLEDESFEDLLYFEELRKMAPLR